MHIRFDTRLVYFPLQWQLPKLQRRRAKDRVATRKESRKITDDVRLCGESFLEILIYRAFSITIGITLGILEGGAGACIMTSANNNVTAGFCSRPRSFMYRANRWNGLKALRRIQKSDHDTSFIRAEAETNAKYDYYYALKYYNTGI